MSWEQNLQDVSFRGIKFDCLHVQDSAQRDTSCHEYPYVDGADVEDLGRKARRISISAVFYGEDYESRLQAFMAALDKPGPGELIHPIFGSIQQAQLTDYQIGHEADNPDYCTVELNFIEATPANPFFDKSLPVQTAEAVSQLADIANEAGGEAFSKAVDDALGSGTMAQINALRELLTGTFSQIRGMTSGTLSSTLDWLMVPRSFANDISSMLYGLVDLRSFSPDMLMSFWGNMTQQMGSVVLLPEQIASGSKSGTSSSQSQGQSDSQDQGTGQPLPARPVDVAAVAAVVQVSVATVMADTAADILAQEADTPTLSPPEIERIANDVRDVVQDAIDQHRDLYPVEVARPVTEALKEVALAIQNAAVVVIEAAPPLTTRTVEARSNLHLVAHKWYGDHSRAKELARLNPQLRDPNELQAGDILNAYAQ